MNSFIKIGKISRVTDSKIKISFSTSNDLERFFRVNSFVIEYGENISEISDEILAIPAVSSLYGIALVNDADLYVETLDETFYETLKERVKILRKGYPTLRFNAEVKTKPVKTNYRGVGLGLLFSGGVDAFFSFIKHRDEKPELYMVIGSEIPYENRAFIENAERANREFAEREGLPIHFIETDMRDTWNETLLNSEYGNVSYGYSFYEAFNIGLFLMGVCAPVTVGRINTLIIPSSYTGDYDVRYGSEPDLDEATKWANVGVVHNGYDVFRSEKIKKISQDVVRTGKPVTLRVCNYASQYTSKLNCSKCEKCCRTITQLLINGVDPNQYGFEYSPNMFKLIREKIESNEFFTHEDKIWFWRDLQKSIPNELSGLPEFTEFTRWLKGFDLKDAKVKVSPMKARLLPFYSILPKSLRRRIRAYYSKTFL